MHGRPKSATRAAQPPLQHSPAPLALHGFGEPPWNHAVVLRLRRNLPLLCLSVAAPRSCCASQWLPPKPCKLTLVPGACGAYRLARVPEIGHPCSPTPATASSSALRLARFWRNPATRANISGVLPASHFWGREKHFVLFLLPSSLFLGREEHSGNLHLFSKDSRQTPVRLPAGSGGARAKGWGNSVRSTPRKPAGPRRTPHKSRFAGPRSAHSGPSPFPCPGVGTSLAPLGLCAHALRPPLR